MKTNDDDADGKILGELLRILQGHTGDLRRIGMTLPSIGPHNALAFLRTVPTGATLDEIRALASAFVAKRPSM